MRTFGERRSQREALSKNALKESIFRFKMNEMLLDARELVKEFVMALHREKQKKTRELTAIVFWCTNKIGGDISPPEAQTGN